MARDVSLLMQDGIGEVAEPGGGSSTLPHKRNPAGSAIVLAAGVRLPGLVSSYLAAMSQEHQRGLGGWHVELPIVAASVQATGSALAAAAAIADGLEVFPAVMRANLDRTRGVVFAERAMMLLAPVLGRDGAQALVKEAVGESRRAGRSLGEVLRERPEVRRALDVEALATLDSPEAYLGDAERIRHTLLAEASQALPAAE
jgi:3-carboxy-cis,cis-muconate cycloisomerase